MDVKVKCWNAELCEWDECAYPIFEGMNPLKIIGFQDSNNIERLVSDGHQVVLYTGLNDIHGNEIYDKSIVDIKGHPFEGSIDIDGRYEVGYNERMELCCGNLLLHRQLPYVTVVGSVFDMPDWDC